MHSEPVLSVKGVSKCFRLYDRPHHRLIEWASAGRIRRHREHWALCKVDFAISSGETFGVMGRNGAGKTTLLGLLAGVLAPTNGVIRSPPRVASLINLGAGFDPDATGADNARHLTAVLDGGPVDEAGIDEIADFAELGDAMQRPFKTYSAGMQLRLAFACASRHRPDLLIIDEVMAVGDFFFRRKCHARIRKFVEQGTAAILVSHDYTEIVQFCRRALVLDAGKVLFLGDASTAVNRYLHATTKTTETNTILVNTASHPVADKPNMPWPATTEQIDTSTHRDWILQGVRITSLACCDALMSQRWAFSQGEMASIYVEVEATEDIRVPIITVMITDERGVAIHGSSTHMKGQGPQHSLISGARIRVRCNLSLTLRYGEYLMGISVGDLDPGINSQRDFLTFEELGASVRQLGHCPRVGVIAIVPRQGGQPAQLTHHGIADLPGTMTIETVDTP